MLTFLYLLIIFLYLINSSAEEQQCGMSELTLAQLQTISPLFQSDIAQSKEWWNFERSVESRAVPGGTNRERVKEQIEQLRLFVEGKH